MKRSGGIVMLGAAGLCLAAWGADRSLQRLMAPRPAAPLPAECVRLPNGAMPDLPQCRQAAGNRSSSSSSFWRSGPRRSGWDSSSASAPSGPSNRAVSRGGFGSSRSFSGS